MTFSPTENNASHLATTLFDTIWKRHVVNTRDGWDVLYIDRHLGHDGASRALHLLKKRNLPLRRPSQTLLSFDHVIPTQHQTKPLEDANSQAMLETVREAVEREQIAHFYDVGDIRNGIIHVVGPEQGYTLPGCTIVCGDSHTSTHGAFGALAFGIGASEVAHVFATQTLLQRKPRSMRVLINGHCSKGVYAKDVILGLISTIGVGGGIGHVIEYQGSIIENMSMEARMTICNMSIEAGAKAGLIAPDETTFAYLKNRPLAPQGKNWELALADWRTLRSAPTALFDTEIVYDVSTLSPQVTWGTHPGMTTSIEGSTPSLEAACSAGQRDQWKRAMAYMDIKPNQPLEGLKLDRVFIGSCTNSRIEDLREAALLIKDKRVASTLHAMVVPGSGLVKKQAEQEGLDKLFKAAGFEWREPGCSMCVGMNGDLLNPGERCASTTNRNFEGRQGRGGRTHLVSPAMAAASAIAGKLVDVRAVMQ